MDDSSQETETMPTITINQLSKYKAVIISVLHLPSYSCQNIPSG